MNPHTKEQVYAIAIASGFKPKLQPDSTMDLNPYVYTFAQNLLSVAVHSPIFGHLPFFPCVECGEKWSRPARDLKLHQGHLWCHSCWREKGEDGVEWHGLSEFVPELPESVSFQNTQSIAHRLECAESALDERGSFIDCIQDALKVKTEPHQTLDIRMLERANELTRKPSAYVLERYEQLASLALPSYGSIWNRHSDNAPVRVVGFSNLNVLDNPDRQPMVHFVMHYEGKDSSQPAELSIPVTLWRGSFYAQNGEFMGSPNQAAGESNER